MKNFFYFIILSFFIVHNSFSDFNDNNDLEENSEIYNDDLNEKVNDDIEDDLKNKEIINFEEEMILNQYSNILSDFLKKKASNW